MSGTGKGVLRIAIEDFLETFDIGKLFFKWWKTFIERLEKEAISVYTDLAKLYYPTGKFPPPFDPKHVNRIIVSSQNGIWVWIVSIAGLVLGGVFGYGQPSSRLASYDMDKLLRTFRPDPATLTAMLFRHGNFVEPYHRTVEDLGIPNVFLDAYEKLYHYMLTPIELEQLRLKGKISENEYKSEMTKLGVTPQRIEEVQGLLQIIPGVSDLIRMAVREAFSDDVVNRFKYNEAFPEKILEHTRKQGLSDDWVKRFWYAHWELPSPTAGYEMLHRLRPGKTDKPFTVQDLDLLLRTADYAPYFRDRMIEISYNPLTRVDVRRMYKLGVLDENGLIDAYLDLGYSQENAERLKEFTKKYEQGSGEDKDDEIKRLSEGLAKRLYSKGLITIQQYKDRLKALKYDDDVIELITDLTDAEISEDLSPDFSKQFLSDMINDIEKAFSAKMIDEQTARHDLATLGITDKAIDYIIKKEQYQSDLNSLNLALKLVTDAYMSGALSRNDFIAELGRLNITGALQSKVINDVELNLKFRNRRLTESQYRQAALGGKITLDDYKKALIGLGYPDSDIAILVALYF